MNNQEQVQKTMNFECQAVPMNFARRDEKRKKKFNQISISIKVKNRMFSTYFPPDSIR